MVVMVMMVKMMVVMVVMVIIVMMIVLMVKFQQLLKSFFSAQHSGLPTVLLLLWPSALVLLAGWNALDSNTRRATPHMSFISLLNCHLLVRTSPNILCNIPPQSLCCI